MSLTAGSGPFGKRPAGQFNFEPRPPGSAIFWEPVPYRVRALVGDEVVVDSRNAHLLHETGHLPVYYFPPEDVRVDVLVPSETSTNCPYKGEANYYSCRIGDRVVEDLVWEYREPVDTVRFIAGRLALYWRKTRRMARGGRAGDGASARPVPPGRCLCDEPACARVARRSRCVADSTRVTALFETGSPATLVLPGRGRADGSARAERDGDAAAPTKGRRLTFTRSDTRTSRWTYREPLSDGERARGLIAFYGERVDLELDGVPQERPQTQWLRT